MRERRKTYWRMQTGTAVVPPMYRCETFDKSPTKTVTVGIFPTPCGSMHYITTYEKSGWPRLWEMLCSWWRRFWK